MEIKSNSFGFCVFPILYGYCLVINIENRQTDAFENRMRLVFVCVYTLEMKPHALLRIGCQTWIYTMDNMGMAYNTFSVNNSLV